MAKRSWAIAFDWRRHLGDMRGENALRERALGTVPAQAPLDRDFPRQRYVSTPLREVEDEWGFCVVWEYHASMVLATIEAEAQYRFDLECLRACEEAEQQL